MGDRAWVRKDRKYLVLCDFTVGSIMVLLSNCTQDLRLWILHMQNVETDCLLICVTGVHERINEQDPWEKGTLLISAINKTNANVCQVLCFYVEGCYANIKYCLELLSLLILVKSLPQNAHTESLFSVNSKVERWSQAFCLFHFVYYESCYWKLFSWLAEKSF